MHGRLFPRHLAHQALDQNPGSGLGRPILDQIPGLDLGLRPILDQILGLDLGLRPILDQILGLDLGLRPILDQILGRHQVLAQSHYLDLLHIHRVRPVLVQCHHLDLQHPDLGPNPNLL